MLEKKNYFYTYFLTHLPTGLKYYGVRKSSLPPENDLWIRYFSSSQRVKQLINEYGKDSFTFEIRKTFQSFDNAQNWEAEVLSRLKVTKRKDWLNFNIRGSKFKNYGKRDPSVMQRVFDTQIQRYGTLGFRQKESLNKQKETWKSKYGTDTFKDVGKAAFKAQTGYDNIRHIKAVCNVCGKEGQLVALKRWHFDKCKHNKI